MTESVIHLEEGGGKERVYVCSRPALHAADKATFSDGTPL